MPYDSSYVKTPEGDARAQREVDAAKQRDDDYYRRSIMNHTNRERRAKGLPPRALKDFK